MIPAIVRFIFNLAMIAAAGVAIWLILFVVLRTIRLASEAVGFELGDFTSWMTKPIRDFIKWRKEKADEKMAERDSASKTH